MNPRYTKKGIRSKCMIQGLYGSSPISGGPFEKGPPDPPKTFICWVITFGSGVHVGGESLERIWRESLGWTHADAA